MHIVNGIMRYSIGDRVVVTRSELPAQCYNPGNGGEKLYWNSKMNQYCGRVVTISSILENCRYRIK